MSTADDTGTTEGPSCAETPGCDGQCCKQAPAPLKFEQAEVEAAIRFLVKLGGTPDPTLAGRIRDAVFIADDADTTNWQRGYRACANRVLYELDAAPQVEWTPPPPGDTREQLPDHILKGLRPYLTPYVSTACETARAIGEVLADLYPDVGTDLGKELMLRRERLRERCRANQKFTGQLCAAPHHEWNDDQQPT